MKYSSLVLSFSLAFSLIIIFASQTSADPSSGNSFECPTQEPAFCLTGTPCSNCPSCPEPSVCFECPTSPSPSPSSPPGCPNFKLNITRLPASGIFGGKEDILQQTNDAPACLWNMYSIVYDECKKRSDRLSTPTINVNDYIDDCVVGFLRGEASFLPGSTLGQNYLKFIKQGYNADCTVLKPGFCDSGVSYFDESCNPVEISKNDISKACDAGQLTWLGTPISLLIGLDLEDLSRESNIVNFPLRPNSNDYSLWKASEKAPLLVFDPEHKGKIVSSEQLFGEWTFGGKAQASLTAKTKSDANLTSESWENGFSALATLDNNMDGKVAGEELASLGLWYDTNRNAISDQGEVRSLEEVGIKTLYYKNAEKDSVTNDIVLNLGYEIETSGVLSQGVAVDWYGVTANSKAELLQRKDLLARLCNAVSETVASLSSEPTSDFASQSSKDTGFSGTWDWISDGEVSAGGMMILSSDTEGKFEGVSMFQTSFEKSPQINFSKTVQILKLHGSLASNSGSESPHLVFVSQSEDGTLLESKVELSTDKKHLSGRTTAFELSGNTKKMHTFYTWTAVRRINK